MANHQIINQAKIYSVKTNIAYLMKKKTWKNYKSPSSGEAFAVGVLAGVGAGDAWFFWKQLKNKETKKRKLKEKQKNQN